MTLQVLVCGGRNYYSTAVWKALDELKAATTAELTIIQGGGDGADQMAREWCQNTGCHLINEPANWAAYGKAAGPIRNQKMLDDHKPDVVIAFPGGTGTRDMVERARKADVTVIVMNP